MSDSEIKIMDNHPAESLGVLEYEVETMAVGPPGGPAAFLPPEF